VNGKGYLIVLKPSVNICRYERSDFVLDNQDLYREFRRSFSKFDYGDYGGISRQPLEGYSSPEERQPDGPIINQAARVRLSEILPNPTPEYYDDSLIQSIEDAESIYAALKDQACWDIIEIRLGTFCQNGRGMGFDIGYWGGDHFSLIADTIVIPRWHPPDPDDYAELADRLSALNEHLLFDTASTAAEFKTYYKSKPWAETEFEEDQFSVIQVRAGRAAGDVVDRRDKLCGTDVGDPDLRRSLLLRVRTNCPPCNGTSFLK
jgi:hypothetical protein